jgi:hypothetical protein
MSSLTRREGKVVDTSRWIAECDTLTLRHPVTSQNDAMEFIDLLLAECTLGMQAEGDTTYLTPAPSALVPGVLRGLGVGVTTHRQGHTCGHSEQRTVLEQGIRLEAKGITSVESALVAWGRTSQMAGISPYRCPECQQYMDASEQQVANELPDTMVLNVLRMGTSLAPGVPAADQSVITTKTHDRITFPVHLPLNMGAIEKDGKESLYDLSGALIHSGGAQGGHYYTFVRKANTARWFRMDDEEVTEVTGADVEEEGFGSREGAGSRGAVILTYQRRCGANRGGEIDLAAEDNGDKTSTGPAEAGAAPEAQNQAGPAPTSSEGRPGTESPQEGAAEDAPNHGGLIPDDTDGQEIAYETAAEPAGEGGPEANVSGAGHSGGVGEGSSRQASCEVAAALEAAAAPDDEAGNDISPGRLEAVGDTGSASGGHGQEEDNSRQPQPRRHAAPLQMGRPKPGMPAVRDVSGKELLKYNLGAFRFSAQVLLERHDAATAAHEDYDAPTADEARAASRLEACAMQREPPADPRAAAPSGTDSTQGNTNNNNNNI